jgi:hypothetical protein
LLLLLLLLRDIQLQVSLHTREGMLLLLLLLLLHCLLPRTQNSIPFRARYWYSTRSSTSSSLPLGVWLLCW